MNRKIILSEQDHDVLCTKLEGACAITELLISDNGYTKWADDTISSSLGAIALMLNEVSELAKKGEVLA